LIALSPLAFPLPHSFPQAVSAMPIAFLLSTTSDWTRLTFYNLTLLNWSYHLVSGRNSTQLAYAVSSNSMSISKRQYDGMNVTLYIEALAEREATSANVVVEKGGGGIRHGRPPPWGRIL
jgi:hypothetical protein